jgi:hypothetical protein
MGGFNSGRCDGRPIVDNCLTLNLREMMRHGVSRPGENSGGSLVFRDGRTGRESNSVGYEVLLGDERGWLRLMHTSSNQRTGQVRHSDYSVELTPRLQPFGGRRWFFVCPIAGNLCTKLHLPNGAFSFASRRAHRLAHLSQRQTVLDRSRDQAFKLRRRLGDKGGIGDYVRKPKWMRQRTFAQIVDRLNRLEGTVEAQVMEKLKLGR